MITGQGLAGARLHPSLAVSHDADVADVRRLAAATARALDFGPDEGRVAVVATEMATNLVKYATSGRISVRVVQWRDVPGLELVSVDRGPGMADAQRRMADGYSTGGTLGGGLGALSRLSDLFDIYSHPGVGTVLMSRLWRAGITPPVDRQFRVGGAMEAFPGEEQSGDAWAVEQRGPRLAALMADGLGHGADAARAADAATECFRLHHRAPAESIVAEIHRCLRSTRGAAVAVAEIDRSTGRMRFCGLGNISARLLTGNAERRLLSHYGIAGYEARRISATEYDWAAGSRLVLHSDGLSENWTLAGSPGLAHHHPLLTAATVLRDAGRRHDDAAVLAVGEA